MDIENVRLLAQQLVAEVGHPTPPAPAWPVTDRVTRPKPAPPPLGPAGYTFKDPAFGSIVIRVTDPLTNGGAAFRVPSNAQRAAWNSTGSRFVLMGPWGDAHVFAFDGVTATQLPTARSHSYIEPSFSYSDPHALYGVGGLNHHTVLADNLLTGMVDIVLDLAVKYPTLDTSGYVGDLVTTDGDIWVTFFGGPAQDQHRYVHHSQAGLLDVQPFGFKIHALSIDRTGRFVLIYPTAPDLARGVASVQIWDTRSVTGLVPVKHLTGGHTSLGYGALINQDCCSMSSWDAAQWQIRNLYTPTITRDLISPVLLPKEVFLSEHSNWRAARSDRRVPFVSSTFRYGANDTPWRAWDDEIISVATDGSGTVSRFAHHQSLPEGDFWSQPIVNVDPSGRYALFTSNWGKTLGLGRQDVFLVILE